MLVLGLPAGLSAAHAQIPPVPPGWQLERAVLLSRHGVRAPTESNEELDQHAVTPWPAWPVAPGFLTPRGAELMRLMGAYYRVLYGGRGLVQADDCPPAGTVAAWSDVDQRTRVSGASLLAGIYPRCATLA
ncbi:MAG TPA: histidine-type phosphatase, partial [Reyranella sp.]|nr:histidine-type phosphatase [Reyranella sp.]